MAENVGLRIELGQAVRDRNDGGAYPSICVNNGCTVVKINNSAGLYNRLYCNVGKIERAGNISWGDRDHFEDGLYPRVAINSRGTVVEVHQSVHGHELHYRVGQVNDVKKEVEWGSIHHYESGMYPAVALLDGGTVIGVYQASGRGYYQVGAVNAENETIKWGNSNSIGPGREFALAANQDGAVVEVHKGVRGDNLHYRVGQLMVENQTIQWGEDLHYDGRSNTTKGNGPSVAINSEGHVVEVHATGIFGRKLRRRVGVVNMTTQTINWVRKDIDAQYDTGMYPSVCLNDNTDMNLVETHISSLGGNIMCCTGTLQ